MVKQWKTNCKMGENMSSEHNFGSLCAMWFALIGGLAYYWATSTTDWNDKLQLDWAGQ
jgi:hypothetical protein